jgi:hypothetical protein
MLMLFCFNCTGISYADVIVKGDNVTQREYNNLLHPTPLSENNNITPKGNEKEAVQFGANQESIPEKMPLIDKPSDLFTKEDEKSLFKRGR